LRTSHCCAAAARMVACSAALRAVHTCHEAPGCVIASLTSRHVMTFIATFIAAKVRACLLDVMLSLQGGTK
jgi:hypothetical protein